MSLVVFVKVIEAADGIEGAVVSLQVEAPVHQVSCCTKQRVDRKLLRAFRLPMMTMDSAILNKATDLLSKQNTVQKNAFA